MYFTVHFKGAVFQDWSILWNLRNQSVSQEICLQMSPDPANGTYEKGKILARILHGLKEVVSDDNT